MLVWLALVGPPALAAPRLPDALVGAGRPARVVVEATGDDTDWLVAVGCDVEAHSAVDGAVVIQATCPPVALARLPEAPGARRLRLPAIASPKGSEGAVVTEGYDLTMATDWHAAGITGEHVHVAILDVGFEGYEGLLGTELPSTVDTDFSFGDPTSSRHGAAVAEIVHDFAPDASIELVTFTTDVEFACALQKLVDEGVDVVNGSVGFDDVWTADGSSLMSLAVTAARNAGVIYVAAAGNENGHYVIGPLRGGLADDVTLNGRWATRVATGGAFPNVILRWSEPFGAAAVDLDLSVLNAAGPDIGGVCGRSSTVQAGDGDPAETASTYQCTPDAEGYLYAKITRKDATQSVDGLTAWLYDPSGVVPEQAATSDDLTLPADAAGAISIGAYDADNTVPDWSSRGPTDDGRAKPDLAAPTAVSTATTGPLAFDGTSASAPHAAGLAALWLDATHDWGDPEGFRAFAVENAVDLAPAGLDNASGAGALHADTLPARVCGCSSEGGAGDTWGLGAVLLALGRRGGLSGRGRRRRS